LTAGCERQVCDRLAWSLVHHGQRALREWRLVDIAVLDGTWTPRVLLEAKACDTVDVEWEGGPKRRAERDQWGAQTYLEALLWQDAAKMAERAPNAARYTLVVVVHVHNPSAIPSPLLGKYGRGRLRGVEAQRDDREATIRTYLGRLGGEVTRHALGVGEHLAVRIEVGAYLAGPLTLTPTPIGGRAAASMMSEAAATADDTTRTIAERREALIKLGEERPDLEGEAAGYLERMALHEDAEPGRE